MKRGRAKNGAPGNRELASRAVDDSGASAARQPAREKMRSEFAMRVRTKADCNRCQYPLPFVVLLLVEAEMSEHPGLHVRVKRVPVQAQHVRRRYLQNTPLAA